MSRRLLLCGTVLVASVSSCASGPDPSTNGAATVIRVVDGDTLVVDLNGQEERVRLIGVDTPETVHPSMPVECFGPEASSRLEDLTPPGATLRLERDEELRDHYGRILAYAHTSEGTFVNRQLVEEGYGEAMEIPPNTALTRTMREAETRARSVGAGLWTACEAG